MKCPTNVWITSNRTWVNQLCQESQEDGHCCCRIYGRRRSTIRPAHRVGRTADRKEQELLPRYRSSKDVQWSDTSSRTSAFLALAGCTFRSGGHGRGSSDSSRASVIDRHAAVTIDFLSHLWERPSASSKLQRCLQANRLVKVYSL